MKKDVKRIQECETLNHVADVLGNLTLDAEEHVVDGEFKLAFDKEGKPFFALVVHTIVGLEPKPQPYGA